MLEAQALAENDPSLDRLFNVAPIVPFRAAAPTTPESLVTNSVVGFFPVCPWEDRAVDEGVVDFTRVVTVDRDTLFGARLAVLSVEARRSLMFALARFWIFRAPQLAFELQDAVGQRIVDVRVAAQNPLVVELELSDGSLLKLIQPPNVPSGGGVERSPVA